MGSIPRYIYNDLKEKAYIIKRQRLDEIISPLEKEISEKRKKLMDEKTREIMKLAKAELISEMNKKKVYDKTFYSNTIYIEVGCHVNRRDLPKDYDREEEKLDNELKKKRQKLDTILETKLQNWILSIWQDGTTDMNIKLPTFDDIDLDSI